MRWQRQRCDACRLTKLEQVADSPAARLLNRASHLLTDVKLNIVRTADELTFEEREAMSLLQSELNRYQPES